MPTIGDLESTYRPIQQQLDALDGLLAEVLQSDVDCVNEMLQYASRYSGKRLRPALIFLIGDMVGTLSENHVKLGAVVEMIHMATLVHDDVLDRATVRRNAESVNVRWNNKDAILLGDIMFSRAINLLVQIGSPRALELLTAAVSTLCEGEIHQNQLSGDPDVDEATYTEIIRRKTACLYASGCELAALLAGAEPRLVEAFSQFGMNLGIAFQIIDDCLDLIGDEEVAGKSLGTDIVNGKMTLPLIQLMTELSTEDRERVAAVIRADTPDPSEIKALQDLLRSHGSVAHALSQAEAMVREAVADLRPLLDTEAFATVEAIASFVINRQS
jgi:octaprenyl-diphosphate synthase